MDKMWYKQLYEALFFDLGSSNVFYDDLLFYSRNFIQQFIRLEKLSFENIQSTSLTNLWQHLEILPNLHSLILCPCDAIDDKSNFYQSIFRLPVLKYCDLSFQSTQNSIPITVSTGQSSSIEHLIIDYNASINEFIAVLSYLPHLRRLSWDNLYRLHDSLNVEQIASKHLTHVTLDLQSTSFDEFESMIIHLFAHLKVLRFSGRSDQAYLDSNRWERLISTYMPRLRRFVMAYEIVTSNIDDVSFTCTGLNSLFTSSFWREHQWFFNHRRSLILTGVFYGPSLIELYDARISFYSTYFFKDKDYAMFKEADNECCSHSQPMDFTALRSIEFAREGPLMNSANSFPNVKELTLSFAINHIMDQIINKLTSILFLNRLTYLYIGRYPLRFENALDLLEVVPNITSFGTYSTEFDLLDLVLIEKTEKFQLISNTNVIKQLGIGGEYNLEEMKLLMNLFPRLQHMRMMIVPNNVHGIYELLSSNINEKSWNLFSLCLIIRHQRTLEEIENLLEGRENLDDFMIKLVNDRLYIWW